MPRASRRTGFFLTAALLSASCDDAPAAPNIEEVDPLPRSTMSTPSYDRGYRLALMWNGDVVMVGTTDSILDGPHAGESDIFVRRYHPEGELIWGRQFGSAQDETPYGVATGADGAVYVVGQTAGSIAGTRGTTDGFVRAYDMSGNVLWTRQLGTTGDDLMGGVTVGQDGSIYVGGYTSGEMAPGGLGGIDAVLRKYTPNGEIVWTRQFGTPEVDAVLSVAVGDSGSIIVSGITGGNLRAGAHMGGNDAFVRKYTPDGGHVWTRQVGSTGGDVAWGVGVDDVGRIHVGGYTEGSLFGPLGGPDDAFYWRLSRSGATLISEQFGTPQSDRGLSLAVDSNRNAYVIGSTFGVLDGPGTETEDGFVRRYLGSGAVGWTRQMGTDSADSFVGVAATPDAIFVSGGTDGAMGTANAGGHDAFIRRLDGNGQTVWTDQ